MTLEIVVPEANAKERTAKDLVFSVLVDDKPKTLTQLHRALKKRYNKLVTFQAVLKAVRSLHSHGVIAKKGRLYSINKEWVFETRNFFDRLYTEQFKVKKPMKRIELGKEVTVYTITNLLELDRLWNDLLTNWAKKEKDDKLNVWLGSHCWWLIPRLQEEDILHDLFAKKKIKTYNLMTSHTMLDRLSIDYYTKKKEFCKADTSVKLDGDRHLSAFGSTLMKFEIPSGLSSRLERIYSIKRIEDLDLKKVLDIFKSHAEIEVTVLTDKMMADRIKEEVIGRF